MTHQNNTSPPDTGDEHEADAPRKSHKGRIAAAIVGVVVLAGIGLGAAGVSAHGDRGWGWHRGPISLESIQERAKDKIAWFSGKVDANAEQQQELETIVDALVADLFPMMEQHRAQRRALITELTRPEFDRVAVDAVRRDMIASLDSSSASLVDALAQASEVLTPEQRQRLSERLMRHHHR